MSTQTAEDVVDSTKGISTENAVHASRQTILLMILLVSLLCRSLSPAPKIVVDSGQYSSASQVLVCYNCWGWRHKERERE